MWKSDLRRLSFHLLPLALSACGIDNMSEQPRYDPYEPSGFFADSMSSRKPVEGTVPRGHVRNYDIDGVGPSRSATEDGYRYSETLSGGEPPDTLPFPVTPEMLRCGRERFVIYCAPCHGRTGVGNGLIVQRGFPAPPSFYEMRLLDAPDDHYFNVITNGFGRMYSYAYRVEPADRWAIVAYIRALQLSRTASLEDVPPKERAGLRDRNPAMGGEP